MRRQRGRALSGDAGDGGTSGAWDARVARACADTAAALTGLWAGDPPALREAPFRAAWISALSAVAGPGVQVRADGPARLQAMPPVTALHDAVAGEGGGRPFAMVAEHKVWRAPSRREEALWDAAVVAATVSERRAGTGYLVAATADELLDDGDPLAALLTGGAVGMAATFADPAFAGATAWFMIPGLAGEGRVPAEIIAVPVARAPAGVGPDGRSWSVAAARIVPGSAWTGVPPADPGLAASSPPVPRFLRDRQKALVERFVDEVLNTHDTDALDRFVTPGFRSGIAGGPADGGVEDLRAWLAELFAAFPDIRWRSNLMLYEEETVVARLTAEGTHLGPFRGIAPTGRTVRIEAVHIVGLEHGLMATHYRVADARGVLEQLTA